MSRRILVTNALPYANGPIHVGHLVGYIQADIWVRFQKLRGHECHYVCADDAHGTPIMLKARAEDIDPEALIRRFNAEHQRDFADFLVGFDNYHSTHSEENQELSELIYKRLDEAGHIAQRTISQAYDEQAGMFLPDRFIRGECPRCGTTDQYGDACEACGASYAPTELKHPVSVISGKPPVERESLHYFFKLGEFEDFLKDWTGGGHLQDATAAKLAEWFEDGLQDWDISRDAPYFGFKIPDTEDKYFYVWLDAPIGYMASFKNLCEKEGIDFDQYWKPGHETELYHFIGKDIVYFHALFWPAMLQGAGFRLPTGIFANGFLTVNGEKMSKSRGTFIQARTWLEHLPAEYLRYYFAARLGPGVEDLDLSLDDFLARVNSDLVGKYVNIASRCAGFLRKRFDNRLGDTLDAEELVAEFGRALPGIAELYEQRSFAQAMREIMALADRANQYVNERQPWVIAKRESKDAELQAVCTTALNLFRLLTLLLKPVLPDTAERAEAFLNIPALDWSSGADRLLDHQINDYTPLLTRIEQQQIDDLLEAAGGDLEAK